MACTFPPKHRVFFPGCKASRRKPAFFFSVPTNCCIDETSNMAEHNASPDNRWWESYALRYLVPTMTGMLLLRWLQLNTRGFFSHMLPPAGKLANAAYTFQQVSMPELLIWMGSGFAFAYLASLPVLAFHASRSLDARTEAHRVLRVITAPLTAVLFLGMSAVGLVALKHAPALQVQIGGTDWKFLAILPVLLFSCAQMVRIYLVSREKSLAVNFAEKLATARTTAAAATPLAAAKDYVTSYRHLREHGNVAFIVVLQIALTSLLYVLLAGSPNQPSWDWEDHLGEQWISYGACLLLLVIWVAPSVGVHQLSQMLERALTSDAPAFTARHAVDKLIVCTSRSSKRSPTAQAPEMTSSSPTIARPFSTKQLLRTLQALSQFSAWLLPLAFCPPILLLWIHLSDLHYPALLLPAISSTAGLGTLLLLGGLVWLAWFLSLATPSILIALTTSLYGRGNAPPSLAWSWTAAGVFAAIYAAIANDSSQVQSIFIVNAMIALIPAIAVLVTPPSPNVPARSNASRSERFWLAIGVGIIAFFALTFLLFPLFLLGQSMGGAPHQAVPLARVALLTCLLALTPGLLYAFFNTQKGRQPRGGMSYITFASTLLVPPFLAAIVLNSAKSQFIYTTLVASGVVDSFSEGTGPGLYRLPEAWTANDRELTSSFPTVTQCLKSTTALPEPGRWICGYRNFSFGAAQLICDKPYANAAGEYTKLPMTCVTYVGNQILGLNLLPPPGRDRRK
jgi:hypothetical protein